MLWLLWLVVMTSVTCLVTFRLAAWLLVWYAWHKVKVKVTFGSVGFFAFKNITMVDRKGNKVTVESLWMSSGLVTNDVDKVLCVCVDGVHIFKSALQPSPTKPTPKSANSQTESENNKPSAAKINSSLIMLLQHVGITVHDLEIHIKTALIHWDVILTDLRLNVSQCDDLHGLELAINNVTFHGRNNELQLLFVLSYSLNLNILLKNGGQGKTIADNFIQNVDLKLQHPRGFMKEELLTLIAEQKSIEQFDSREIADNSSNKKKSKVKLVSLVPTSAKFEVTDSNFSLSRDSDSRNLTLNCQNLTFTMAQTGSAMDNINHLQLSLTSDLKSFDVWGVRGKILELESLSQNLKSDLQTIHCVVKTRKTSFEYQHVELLYWLTVLKSLEPEKRSPDLNDSDAESDIDVAVESPSPIQSYVASRSVTVTLDVNDVTTDIPSDTGGFSGGLRYVKIRLDLKPDENFKNRNYKFEILVDTVYWQLGQDTILYNRNEHDWSTVLYLGNLSSKVTRQENAIEIETNVDCLHVHWSSRAVQTAVGILNSMRVAPPADHPPDVMTSLSRQQSRDQPKPKEITIVGKISHINIFVTNDKQHLLMFRLDAITADHELKTAIVHASGGKLILSKLRTQKSYSIVPSVEIQDYIGHVSEIKHVVRMAEKEVSVSVMDDVNFYWTTGFQMMLYEVQNDVRTLKDAMCEFRLKQGQELIKTEINLNHPPASESSFLFELTLGGGVLLSAQLSRDHNVTVNLDRTEAIVESSTKMEILVQNVSVEFDGHEIFLVQELCVSCYDQSEDFDAERQSFENLKTSSNKAWLISLGRFGIIFPHKYRFALCWERLMRTRKFLKKLHSDPNKPKSWRLPPDIGVKVKVLHVQIDDDPFEVKLGDNYALLVDEHKEREKRVIAMDRRIHELRKKHGLLPPGKVDDLYTSLNQKNSSIYLKRSFQQYNEHPMRTALFQWKMEELEVYLLADETLNGDNKCREHMKQIDSESPFPESLEFNTLFGRMLNSSVSSWTVQLRDYTQPMLDVQDMHMWGRLIVAEPMGTPRARYTVTVEVPDPWDDVIINKNMPNPKFYHDFSCDIKSWIMAYGACWEPCVAQYNHSVDLINKPSIDPSKPMPFWDKIRLLYHGRLTMSMQQMSWLYHTSLDPFNSTEFMDWTWTSLVFDWTNGKFVLKGDLDVYLRTASKYDDCRFLHLPHLRFIIGLDWLCRGDRNDHHSVMPCHPDKVPEFSLEEHDSYRAFRSQKVNLSLSMETNRCQDEEGFEDMPCCLFYSSTARFLEKIKTCIARISRPIKRGTYYLTRKPKKVPLTRHYNNISVQLKFTNAFQVCYWASFAKQHGLELVGNSFHLDGVFRLDLIPQEGRLARRPIASWSVVRLGMELDKAQTWVCSTSQDDQAEEANTSMRSPVIRSFFFSIRRLGYARDEKPEHPPDVLTDDDTHKPVHQVSIHDLKGAWTPRNRNIMIRLYDGYSKASALRRALSSDALKGYKMEGTNTPMKRHSLNNSLPSLATPSPLTRLQQSGQAFSLLQKLVAETESKFVAFAEEAPSVGLADQLHGVASCQTGDVIKRNWAIDLHNSQVIMRGIETSGYVIVSASRAQILSCEHRALWHDQQLKTKTTWVGSLECMQYYCTVAEQPDDDTYWLTEDNVVPCEDTGSRIPEMAGCGQSVGGVVTRTVDSEGNEHNDVVLLQRVISRCRCQFFYASYSEADRSTLSEVPPIPASTSTTDLERAFDEGVDSLTLLHHDLNICTNSNQYHIMLDIVNNLLLYVEPKKKLYTDKVQAMRFKVELLSMDETRTTLLALQEKLRQNILSMRTVERELFLTHRQLEDEPFNDSLIEESDELESTLYKLKEQISNDGEDLCIMISGYVARQLEIETRQKRSTKKSAPAMVLRRNEVCFKHAHWRLTELDGQIGIADLVLRNFLYVKTNNNDDSGSHLVELGWAKMHNLLPNSIYKDVLMPQDTGKGKLDDVALRVICRVKPPVGGISVKEHLEINLVPVQIQITNQFYRAMMDFFFPGEEQEPDAQDDTASVVSAESTATGTSKDDKSTFKSYIDLPDDIDKMKERAARNNTFIHVKIPELPLRISYKGEREKNVTDVHDMLIRLPPLEIHNQTWTWLDLLMAVKNSSKRALLSQAIKQKLHIRRSGEDTVTDVQLEEDKAKMLLGAKLVAGTEKMSSKKSLFGKSNRK